MGNMCFHKPANSRCSQAEWRTENRGRASSLDCSLMRMRQRLNGEMQRSSSLFLKRVTPGRSIGMIAQMWTIVCVKPAVFVSMGGKRVALRFAPKVQTHGIGFIVFYTNEEFGVVVVLNALVHSSMKFDCTSLEFRKSIVKLKGYIVE